MKKFHLGDILSISSGYLVSPTLMDGVYEILNYMTGDDLYTHQLPRARKECAPYLLAEMPWLTEIDPSGVNGENHLTWLNEQVKKYGAYHNVRPIHFEDHERKDPIEELIEMRGGDADIIVIDTSAEDEPSPCGDIDWKVDDED